MSAVNDRMDELQSQLQALAARLDVLDKDLDESRRLNLRAAELLDVVYDVLGASVAGSTVPANGGT